LLRRLCATVEITASIREKQTEIEKGRRTLTFPQDSKTIVTDHPHLSSAICAAAFSSTHANLIVRQS
jgi:hypothetical protein